MGSANTNLLLVALVTLCSKVCVGVCTHAQVYMGYMCPWAIWRPASSQDPPVSTLPAVYKYKYACYKYSMVRFSHGYQTRVLILVQLALYRLNQPSFQPLEILPCQRMHVQSCGSRNVLTKDVYRVKNRLRQSVHETTYLEKE